MATEYSVSAPVHAACLEGRHSACGYQECSCACHAKPGTSKRTQFEEARRRSTPLLSRLSEYAERNPRRFMVRLLAGGVMAFALIVICIAIAKSGAGDRSETATAAPTESDPVTAQINNEMQAWMSLHREADRDDADAMEALLDFRGLPGTGYTEKVVVDKSYRTTTGVYCLYLRRENTRGVMVKDKAYTDDIPDGGIDGGRNGLMLAESEMRSDAKAMKGFTAKWNKECRDGRVAKDTTSYLH